MAAGTAFGSKSSRIRERPGGQLRGVLSPRGVEPQRRQTDHPAAGQWATHFFHLARQKPAV